MAVATWWKGDDLPKLAPLPGFHAQVSQDVSVLARLSHLEKSKVRQRMETGHHPYVASLGSIPVGYGWVARKAATIGELALSFVLPLNNRYLWDFATLPEWRGRGVYPHLLQTVLRVESHYANRFWIVHAPENHTSAIGIRKAGFHSVDELSFSIHGGVGLARLTMDEQSERARAAAELLDLPELPRDMLVPCWDCDVIKQMAPGA